ncbi:hypothetical protein ACVGXT_11460, partial [Enterobacter intestinihominis]
FSRRGEMHLTQRQGAVDQVILDVGNVVVHGVDTRVLPGDPGAFPAKQKPNLCQSNKKKKQPTTKK